MMQHNRNLLLRPTKFLKKFTSFNSLPVSTMTTTKKRNVSTIMTLYPSLTSPFFHDSPTSIITNSAFSTSSTSTNSSNTTTTTTSTNKKTTTKHDVQWKGRARIYDKVDVIPSTLPPPTNPALFVRVPNMSNDDSDNSSSSSNLINSSTSKVEWYSVTLDDRPLRTPRGNALVVPSLPLAVGIANEWMSVKKSSASDDGSGGTSSGGINPSNMPLTGLVCAVLDTCDYDASPLSSSTKSNNTNSKKKNKDNVISLLPYLMNDTTCYRTDSVNDRVLRRKQDQTWNALHDWVGRGLSSPLSLDQNSNHDDNDNNDPDFNNSDNNNVLFVMEGKEDGMLIRSGGLPHPQRTIDNMEQWLTSLDEGDVWTRTALRGLTTESKSLLVSMAAVQGLKESYGLLSPSSTTPSPLSSSSTTTPSSSMSLPPPPPPPFMNNETCQTIVDASRVEEEFQISSWGLVEGGHDYDRLNCSVAVRSCVVLLSSIYAAFSEGRGK